MNITTDHIFHIGSQHLRGGMPCQDYATSGEFMHGRFAIVADGCSTGGRTDIGSRVIALATARALAYSTPSPELVSSVRHAYVGAAQAVLGLANEDLLSTCAYAVVMPGLGSFIQMAGDGVCAIESRDGTLTVLRLDWANNMPAYPAYAEDQFAGFKAAHGDHEAAVTLTTYRVGPGLPADTTVKHLALQDGVNGFDIFYEWPEAQKLRHIAVFSDGVTQVDGIEWTDSVRQLLSFKSAKGDFAKRRMHGFLRAAADIGRGPVDDIAYAVIHIEDDE